MSTPALDSAAVPFATSSAHLITPRADESWQSMAAAAMASVASARSSTICTMVSPQTESCPSPQSNTALFTSLAAAAIASATASMSARQAVMSSVAAQSATALLIPRPALVRSVAADPTSAAHATGSDGVESSAVSASRSGCETFHTFFSTLISAWKIVSARTALLLIVAKSASGVRTSVAFSCFWAANRRGWNMPLPPVGSNHSRTSPQK
mmetsp:Transcript_110411/g.321459  ORF Transcript_110411/g.321459 Transcript_110411/m.321459 type:complete len:211 (+) Transcript_110411:401-1033(+)